MCDLSIYFTFHLKKNTESSVTFLRNDVLILNGKENTEATAICFEIRIPKKKNKELLQKVPSKNLWSNFIMEKKSKRMWFVNISEYHQQTMGLLSPHYFSSVYHIYLAVYQRLIALSCTSVVGRLRNYSQHLIVTTNCLRQEKWVVRSLLQLSVSVPSF